MLIRVPDYFDQFHCLAGACPHSCCEKWEVVIDEETAARYRHECGELGEKLRTALQQDAEGDFCFPLNGGRCPFLDEENLCEIHRKLGEAATSSTCQEHPRFTEDYGPFREITLSASCPAANALLLGSQEPLTFLERTTGEAEEEGDCWLAHLLPLRARLLALLQDRSVAFHDRLGQFLQLSAAAQDCLNTEDWEALAQLLLLEIPPRKAALPEDGFTLLEELEILEMDWVTLLRQAETAPKVSVPENLLERAAVYFAFRYILKTVNDGDLLSRAQLCCFAVLAAERIAAVCGLPEALRRFSCEVEHSDENLDRLLEAFCYDQDWTTFLEAQEEPLCGLP